MAGRLRALILAADEQTRNLPVEAVVAEASVSELLAECDDLEAFRQGCDNLYQRVRALFFLHAIHRYHLAGSPDLRGAGHDAGSASTPLPREGTR